MSSAPFDDDDEVDYDPEQDIEEDDVEYVFEDDAEPEDDEDDEDMIEMEVDEDDEGHLHIPAGGPTAQLLQCVSYLSAYPGPTDHHEQPCSAATAATLSHWCNSEPC